MAASANSGIADNLPREKPPRTWGETYLANYNAISAFFWFNVPLRLIQIYTRFGPEQVFDGTVDYVKYIQAMAVLEVVHSAVGLVRSPLFTTVQQVSSRLFLTWGICSLFPDSVRSSIAYPVMLSAWSITEVIRYSFYAWNLLDEVPYPLLWLRYTTFYVLYPIGVGAELLTIKSAWNEAYAWNPLYAYLMIGIVLVYIPGFPMLFGHMVRQRRKTLGATKKKSL